MTVPTCLMVQQVRATNDANGNPQRAWVLMAPGHGEYADVVATYDQGYTGEAFRNALRDETPIGTPLHILPPAQVTTEEYRSAVDWPEKTLDGSPEDAAREALERAGVLA